MKKPQENAKNIRWTGFAASIPGGGHIRHGIPCQDASAVMTSPRPAGIVCDGRGSAKLSHFGAQGAVDAFRFQMAVLEPFLVSILDEEGEKPEQWIKFCRIMYRTLMQVKYDLAEKHDEGEKEFDCTVAFVIAGEKHIGCFQVGDGSIVLRQDGVCRTVFLPEKGEFANQTHFLRPGGEEQMKFQYALLDAGANSGIAITSDGPEHLMFRLADMTPGKIFDMFLDDLRKEELCRQDLMDYLTRREWADDPRGSDDRSLALLARIGAEPAVLPEAIQSEPESVPAVESTELKLAPAAEPEAAPNNQAVPEITEPPAAELEVAPGDEAVTEGKPEQPVTALEVAPNNEAASGMRKGIQTEDPDDTKIPKKKGIPCRTLAIVSALVVGLLAETACLLKQRQTISCQRMEIERLKQELARREQAKQILPEEPTLPPPSQPSAPAAEGKAPKQTPRKPSGAPVRKEKEAETPRPQTSIPVAPAVKKGRSNDSGTGGKAAPETPKRPESKDLHKEDAHEKK